MVGGKKQTFRRGEEGIIVPKLTPYLAGQVQYKVNDRTSKLYGPSFLDLIFCRWSEFFGQSNEGFQFCALGRFFLSVVLD